MRTTWVALGLVMLLLTAGCALPGPGSSASPSEVTAEFERRASAVVAAWQDSGEVARWQEDLLPLEPLTLVPDLPEGSSAELVQAMFNGWLQTDLEFTDERLDDGEVRFPDGEVRAVPLVSQAQAWQAVFHEQPECADQRVWPLPTPTSDDPDNPVGVYPRCTSATVTDSYLGVVVVQTSRGPAQVPAWLFDVAEVDEPLARLAVDPDVVADVPVLHEVNFPHFRGLATAETLVEIDGTRLTYRVGVGSCDLEPDTLVYETDDAIVVGGTSRLRPGTRECTDDLQLVEVTVTLSEPVGLRPVLATTGAVLTFGRWW